MEILELNLKSPNKLPPLCVNGNEERSAGCRNIKLAKYATKVAENRKRKKNKKEQMFPFSREIFSPEQKSNVTSSPQVFNAQFHHAFRPFPFDRPQHITAYMVNCKTCAPGKYIGHRERDSSFRPAMCV